MIESTLHDLLNPLRQTQGENNQKCPITYRLRYRCKESTHSRQQPHQNHSGKSMEYMDPFTNEKFVPYCVEPSLGADRVALAFLCDAYDEEVVGQDKNGKDDVRVVLHLHPALAPYKAAILPLSKKLSEPAMEIYNDLCKDFMLDFDETGSIGKRYRREDEIGTPFCITVDFDTVGDGENPGDHCVTVRERDTMEQVRIPISELKAYLTEKLAY